MRVIKQSTLRIFWLAHGETKAPLQAWHDLVSGATWTGMNDVLATFPKAVPLNGERVRFPILGGNYRLIAALHFPSRVVWIKFIGTHAEYDRVDALTVDRH